MDWFDRLYPAGMVLLPALISMRTPAHPSAAADAPEKTRRLYRFTMAALFIHVVVTLLFEGFQQERGGLRAAWVFAFPFFSFFGLWFGLAMPALAARGPGWSSNPHPSEQRSASLVSRHTDVESTLPVGAWVFGWSLYALCVGAMFWSLGVGAQPLLSLGLLMWPAFLLGVRAVRTEAEPRDAGGSKELAEAYAGLRRYRAWCFYWCGALGTGGVTVGAVAVAIEWVYSGLVGGIAGSLVGLLGGLMGTLASFKRARINVLLHDLSRAE